jgi:hypothetical protein
MATVIALREVIEAMEITGEDCVSCLDPETGEIITADECGRPPSMRGQRCPR